MEDCCTIKIIGRNRALCFDLSSALLFRLQISTLGCGSSKQIPLMLTNSKGVLSCGKISTRAGKWSNILEMRRKRKQFWFVVKRVSMTKENRTPRKICIFLKLKDAAE